MTQPDTRRLSAQVRAAGQMSTADLRVLSAEGVVLVVNHRPDGEEAGQPASDALATAAESAGIRYVHAPVSGFPGAEAVALTRQALDELAADDQAVFFCRSGMRSTVAWALAERLHGVDPDALREAAADAGYDLSRVPL